MRVEIRRALGLPSRFHAPVWAFSETELDQWERCVAWGRATVQGELVGPRPVLPKVMRGLYG